MTRFWKRWVAFWSRKESATQLALFRVLVGLVTLYSLLSAANGGVIDVLWVGREHGGLVAQESYHWIWRVLDSANSADGTTARNIWALWSIAVGGAVLTAVGLGGRLSLLITQQCYLALTSVNAHASGGYDALIMIALLVLTCSGCHQTLSADCWLRHRRLSRHVKVAAWPRFLLITQLMLMYSATGFQKVGLSWTPMGGYTALHFVLHDPTWTRFGAAWVESAGPLLRVATAISWHWEQLSILMLPVLYFRLTASRPGRLRAFANRWDLRLPWALLGIGMHIGILVLMNVGPFSWISLAYYSNLWSGAEYDRVITALRDRRRHLAVSA